MFIKPGSSARQKNGRKLSEDQVLAIRDKAPIYIQRLGNKKKACVKLAQEYGLSASGINYILTGRIYEGLGKIQGVYVPEPAPLPCTLNLRDRLHFPDYDDEPIGELRS